MTRYLPLLLALALIPGCDNDEEKKKEEPKPAKVEKKPEKKKKKAKVNVSPLAPSEPRTNAGEVPVAANFEEEAARTLAIENLETELDRLEAEIVGVSD